MSRTSRLASMRLRSQSIFKTVKDNSAPRYSSLSDGVVNVTDAPSTPAQNGIAHLRQRLEDHIEGRGDVEIEDNTSPGLARLRMTPGRILKDKQEILIKKHEEVRQRADQLNVGGGVSLWPQMDRMKLTKGEIIQLILMSMGLGASVVFVFQKMHSSSLTDLHSFTVRLKSFSRHHIIDTNHGEDKFRTSLMSWHSDYRDILSIIHKRFDISSSSPVDVTFILGYLTGVVILLYYLIDNMFAKSKLSPRRIKNWVCLLVVIGTWTILMSSWLVLAHQLEYAVEENIHQLSEVLYASVKFPKSLSSVVTEIQAFNDLMTSKTTDPAVTIHPLQTVQRICGDLVNTELDLQVFHTVLEYWRTRCLPPTTHGVLTILGVLPVRDVMYYLQYYSLPVITVLVTPVIKLITALYTVYSV